MNARVKRSEMRHWGDLSDDPDQEPAARKIFLQKMGYVKEEDILFSKALENVVYQTNIDILCHLNNKLKILILVKIQPSFADFLPDEPVRIFNQFKSCIKSCLPFPFLY